jgi:hypothetical protein
VSGRLVLRLSAAVIGLGFVATSCGSPSYEYVRNTSTRTAFKLPQGWRMFDKATFLGTSSGPQPNAPDPIRWLVAFDANPEPSIDHILNNTGLDTPYPQGIALVFSLSFQNRDQINLQTMRNFLIPIDYFQSDDISFLGYDDHVLLDSNQVRGLHIEFEFRQAALPGAEAALAAAAGGAAGSATPTAHPFPIGAGTSAFSTGFVHVDQYVYLDAQAENLYVFSVMCSTTCYQRNAGSIQTAADSWTVLP